jgi:ubiquinone/menaquinone biosynthesis C-methylase UbiE
MSFDSVAPHYRWMEFVLAGNKLQRCRTAFLNSAADARNILVVGEGNGRFLCECRRKTGSAEITCVDASARMLDLARQRLRRQRLSLDHTRFVHADAIEWKPLPSTYDLVVTHFFLDCFRPEQLSRVVASLANASTARAKWLLADFQVPTTGLRRYRAEVIHFLMYAFFGLAARLPARKLHPADDLLRVHGFRLLERRESEWGLLHTDEWARSGT